ncbi:MAG: phosphoribosylformylglycinamidine cyclo-ligase [Endomicrobiia bacterium]
MLYKKSGVDIDKANKFVDMIKKIAPAIGGFSGFFPIDTKKYKKPVLVASTDGVGTKLKIAQLVNKHDTVGIDLVAMCVNDVLCTGAKPLFFLDYFATGKLELKIAKQIIKGINEGCKQAECILLGGETAEMPGFYKKGEYDLAGFAVGIVERDKIIDGRKIKPGDYVFGLPSTGPHSNGYSLIRKIFLEKELKELAGELLKPTKIYTKEIIHGVGKYAKGIAHITGGGFYDNIPRVLPENCKVVIFKNRWQIPEIFHRIQKRGNVSEKEMFRVFNMGIGMVLISSKEKLKDCILIGQVEKGRRGVEIV